KINADGSLSNRSNFALLNLLTKNKVQSWWLGPDSMKVDSKGNIYVAQWFGGKIFKISPGGKLLYVFEIAAGDGTTNVEFGEGGWDYVTVDAAARRLYLSHATKIVVVDLTKNAVIGEISGTPGVHGFIVAPELERGFASNGKESKASIVDLKTLRTISKTET